MLIECIKCNFYPIKVKKNKWIKCPRCKIEFKFNKPKEQKIKVLTGLNED